MKFVNLTPHALNIYRTEIEVYRLAPSGGVARVTETREAVESACVGFSSFSLFVTSYGEVTGLPEPVRGTMYIVSGQVRAAVPHRRDVASPGALVRNAEGQPIGCEGLTINP